MESPSAMALLVIDMLNDFLDRWPMPDRRDLCDANNKVVNAFRAARLPVIWIRQEFEPDLSDALPEMRRKNIRVTIRGTPGCHIVPELQTCPGETVIVKKRYSAFFKTPLDQIVTERGIDTLVLSGINTHACVRTTAIDAYQRDFKVVIPREAVGSYDREHGEISLRYMDDKIATVVSIPVLLEQISPL